MYAIMRSECGVNINSLFHLFSFFTIISILISKIGEESYVKQFCNRYPMNFSFFNFKRLLPLLCVVQTRMLILYLNTFNKKKKITLL